MQNKLDRIISQIAKANRSTPEKVRKDMQEAMDTAMRNPDPRVQAKWASIPKQGEVLTLEEFVEYMASVLTLLS